MGSHGSFVSERLFGETVPGVVIPSPPILFEVPIPSPGDPLLAFMWSQARSVSGSSTKTTATQLGERYTDYEGYANPPPSPEDPFRSEVCASTAGARQQAARGLLQQEWYFQEGPLYQQHSRSETQAGPPRRSSQSQSGLASGPRAHFGEQSQPPISGQGSSIGHAAAVSPGAPRQRTVSPYDPRQPYLPQQDIREGLAPQPYHPGEHSQPTGNCAPSACASSHYPPPHPPFDPYPAPAFPPPNPAPAEPPLYIPYLTPRIPWPNSLDLVRSQCESSAQERNSPTSGRNEDEDEDGDDLEDISC